MFPVGGGRVMDFTFSEEQRFLRDTCRREHRIAAGGLPDLRPLLEGRRYAASERSDALAAEMEGAECR